MKKSKLLFMVATSSLLASCFGSNSYTYKKTAPLEISVAAPKGAPAAALHQHLFEPGVEINAPTNVQAWFLTGALGAIIAPTNAGVKLIKGKNVPYKLAATVTFGNFFLVATGNDDNNQLDADDAIFVPMAQNDIPGSLFRYAYSSYQFTNIAYGGDNSNAVTNLVTGYNALEAGNPKLDYVVVAQPGLSTALASNQKAKIVGSVQEKYKEVSQGKEITQASIFINNSLAKDKADAFLAQIEKETKELQAHPEIVKDVFAELEDTQVAAKLGTNKATFEQVIKDNSLGLGFKKAKENKTSIDNFLITIGDSATSEEIYY